MGDYETNEIKNMNTTKVCKNCKYFKKKWYQLSSDGICTNNKSASLDESGQYHYYYASTCRAFESLCGKDARYFWHRKLK